MPRRLLPIAPRAVLAASGRPLVSGACNGDHPAGVRKVDVTVGDRGTVRNVPIR